MIALLFFLIFSIPQGRQAAACTVTEVVAEGTRSDCHGWKPAKGAKMIMPPEVNKQLKVGDVFYFVWKDTRWVAEIWEPQTATQEPKIVTCTITKDTEGVVCPKDVFDGPIPLRSTPPTWREKWEMVAPMRDGLPNTDAPMGRAPLFAGQKVKMLVEIDGLTALPNCDARVYLNIKKWRSGGREGERLPNTLNTSTDADCQSSRKN